MTQENNKRERTSGTANNDMNRASFEDRLNSDNSFSDQGLTNAHLTREAVKKKDSYQ
ncbi:hypothetical protein [Bacillus taeanensis]|uniref:hypothetical protein n=1 Tax=Bacillus taeanensis TaxID=273032 RepID=UPI0015F0EED8|nr:hypothetical protein [Bacillus taeanensis]